MKEGIVEVLDEWFFSRVSDMHTMLPGKIVQYEGHTTRLASIELQIKYQTKDGQILEYPVIENVPVVFPSSKNFSMVFPLEKGDGCMVLFAETGIGNYIDTSDVALSDSPDRFSMSDAICMPGLWSTPNVPEAPENDTDLWITYKNSTFTLNENNFKIEGSKDTIESEDGTITINGNLEVDV